MNKSLKLIPIEQVLLSYNPISSEINRIIGLYNSRNFDNEINIQSIDGSIFITEGEKEMLEKFVEEELVSLPDFERISGIASGNIATMLQECSKRGDIPSNAYISALSIGGKQYIHKGYLDHFQDRFGAFSDFIESTPEEIEEIPFDSFPKQTVDETENPQENIEPKDEEEQDDEEMDEDEDEDEENKLKEKKKKRDTKRRKERERIEQENRLAETRRQITNAQLQFALEEKYKNEAIRRQAVEHAAAVATDELYRQQERHRHDYEKRITDAKNEASNKAEAKRIEEERIREYNRARENTFKDAVANADATKYSGPLSNTGNNYSSYPTHNSSYDSGSVSTPSFTNEEEYRKKEEERRRKEEERKKAEDREYQHKKEVEQKESEKRKHQENVKKAMDSTYENSSKSSVSTSDNVHTNTYSYSKESGQTVKEKIVEEQHRKLDDSNQPYISQTDTHNAKSNSETSQPQYQSNPQTEQSYKSDNKPYDSGSSYGKPQSYSESQPSQPFDSPNQSHDSQTDKYSNPQKYSDTSQPQYQSNPQTEQSYKSDSKPYDSGSNYSEPQNVQSVEPINSYKPDNQYSDSQNVNNETRNSPINTYNVPKNSSDTPQSKYQSDYSTTQQYNNNEQYDSKDNGAGKPQNYSESQPSQSFDSPNQSYDSQTDKYSNPQKYPDTSQPQYQNNHQTEQSYKSDSKQYDSENNYGKPQGYSESQPPQSFEVTETCKSDSKYVNSQNIDNGQNYAKQDNNYPSSSPRQDTDSVSIPSINNNRSVSQSFATDSEKSSNSTSSYQTNTVNYTSTETTSFTAPPAPNSAYGKNSHNTIPLETKKSTSQMVFEVATVEDISGNKYVVPESKKHRFEELKTQYEAPGATPKSVKDEVRNYERYVPEQYDNINNSNYSVNSPSEKTRTESTSNHTVKSEVSSKRTENNDRPKKDTDTSTQKTIATFPTSSENTNKSDKDTSPKIILTANGKGIAEVSSVYASAIRSAINDTKTPVRGQDKTSEAVRILASSGAVVDEKMKIKRDTFTTSNGMSAVAIARDIYRKQAETNSEGRPLTSQERRELSNKIVISDIVNSVKEKDYTPQGINKNIIDKMAASYEKNSKTEGKELKSFNVVSGQSEQHTIIGNAAGNYKGRQIKVNSDKDLQPNDFHNPNTSFKSKKKTPIKVTGNASVPIVAEGNTENITQGKRSGNRVATTQIMKLNAAYIPIDWKSIVDKGAGEIMSLTERKMRQAQTTRGLMTTVDNVKAVVEVANLLTLGTFSKAVAQKNAANYIKGGAQHTFLLKGNAKTANYVTMRSKVRHAQHDLTKINKIFERHDFKTADGEFAKIDATLGLSLKRGRPLLRGKSDKASNMLRSYCEKNKIDLHEMSDLDIAILANDLRRNKNSKTLLAALQQETGIRGLGKFKGLRSMKGGGFTTDSIINANRLLNAFIKQKTGLDISKFTSKQLRELALQQTNKDLATAFMAAAGVKDAQASLGRATLRGSTSSIKRIFRRSVSSNETFAGYYQMMDTVRQLRGFTRKTAKLTTSIVRSLLTRKSRVIDKKLAKIQNKLQKNAIKYRKQKMKGKSVDKLRAKSRDLKNARSGLIRERNALNVKKSNSKLGRAKNKVNNARGKVAGAKNKVKRVVTAPQRALKNAILNSRAAKKLGNFKNKLVKKFTNSKFGKALKFGKGIGGSVVGFIQKILNLLKALIKYVIIALAIGVALILVTNFVMWLVGEVGNGVESLFGQQDFTEEAAGKALIALQEYDCAFFNSSDAITEKLKTTDLEELMNENVDLFERWFTENDKVYGFLVPKDNMTDPTRFEIRYAGVPYNQSASKGQFQQVYYDGWRGEDQEGQPQKGNIITRYSNAKDILCVANVVYGGEINKFWDWMTGIGGGSSKNYCQQLWMNTHFCSICKSGIKAGESNTSGMCIHTTPLFPCEKGDCDGDGSVNNYKYYCNYNDSDSSDEQKKTFWLYNSQGAKWKLWEGATESIEATDLNDIDDTQDFNDRVNVRLCALSPAIYGIHAEEKGDNKGVSFSTKKVNVGYSYPYMLYGTKMATSSNYYNTFKNAAYMWPVSSKTIDKEYGAQMVNEKVKVNDGIDIKVNTSRKVYAVANGTATTGSNTADGNYVVITHSNGLSTKYSHLDSISVNNNSVVTKGSDIGTVGGTSKSLHFTLKAGGTHIDPMILYGGYYGNSAGKGCVKNYCDRKANKTDKPRTFQGETFSESTNHKKLGYYEWEEAFRDNRLCTNMSTVRYCTNTTSCNNKYTVKHSKTKPSDWTSNYCNNYISYYECGIHTVKHCYAGGQRYFKVANGASKDTLYAYDKDTFESGYLKDWHINAKCTYYKRAKDPNGSGKDIYYNFSTNQYSLTKKNGFEVVYECAGHGAVHDSNPTNAETPTGKDYYNFTSNNTELKNYCGDAKIELERQCKTHTICGGHRECKGHSTCPGHNLAYCTGHTTLITETVIVGLNEYEGQKFETDIMANATWNKYATGGEHGKSVDMEYSTSFSLKNNYLKQLAARDAYNEDWADLYDIEFYQEDTPFRITESEIKSVLLQQEKFSNYTVAKLALLSVGRVGYHDTYSNNANYTKLDTTKEGDEFYAQYNQFCKDVKSTEGADSEGHIMSGLNNNTFLGYILWSANVINSNITGPAKITKATDVLTQLKPLNKPKLKDISSGDVCSIELKVGDKTVTLYGVVVTVNPTESDERGKTGLGTIGAVFALPGLSDAGYMILKSDVLTDDNIYKAKFYTYNNTEISSTSSP